MASGSCGLDSKVVSIFVVGCKGSRFESSDWQHNFTILLFLHIYIIWLYFVVLHFLWHCELTAFILFVFSLNSYWIWMYISSYRFLWGLTWQVAPVASTVKWLVFLLLDAKEAGSNPQIDNIILQFYYFYTYTLYDCILWFYTFFDISVFL